MARKAYVSDDMGSDDRLESIAALDLIATMMWPWLLPYFDDWGRGDGSPRRIKGKLFSNIDQITVEVVERALRAFADNALLVQYEIDGRKYIAIPQAKFHQYQTQIPVAKREKDESKYPPIPLTKNNLAQNRGESRKIAEDCGESLEPAKTCVSPSPSPSPSLTLTPTEDGAVAPQSPPEKASRAKPRTHIDPAFVVPDDVVAKMQSECPSLDIVLATKQFVGYWLTRTDAKGVSGDWLQSWRNAMRADDAADRYRLRGSKPNGSSSTVPVLPLSPTGTVTISSLSFNGQPSRDDLLRAGKAPTLRGSPVPLVGSGPNAKTEWPVAGWPCVDGHWYRPSPHATGGDPTPCDCKGNILPPRPSAAAEGLFHA